MLYGPWLGLFELSLSAGELFSAGSEGCTPLILLFIEYIFIHKDLLVSLLNQSTSRTNSTNKQMPAQEEREVASHVV